MAGVSPGFFERLFNSPPRMLHSRLLSRLRPRMYDCLAGIHNWQQGSGARGLAGEQGVESRDVPSVPALGCPSLYWYLPKRDLELGGNRCKATPKKVLIFKVLTPKGEIGPGQSHFPDTDLPHPIGPCPIWGCSTKCAMTSTEAPRLRALIGEICVLPSPSSCSLMSIQSWVMESNPFLHRHGSAWLKSNLVSCGLLNIARHGLHWCFVLLFWGRGCPCKMLTFDFDPSATGGLRLESVPTHLETDGRGQDVLRGLNSISPTARANI